MRFLTFLLAVLLICGGAGPGAHAQSAGLQAASANAIPASITDDSGTAGSAYVPVDSWIYAALDRLHALGYVDMAYLGLRPWTRLSIARMLEQSEDDLGSESGNDEARSIYFALLHEVEPDTRRGASGRANAALESVYTDLRGISGASLRDSFHLGQSVVNDYGRPYQAGFNNYSGLSAVASAGRFSLYVRAEVEHAPAALGYSPALAEFLSDTVDSIPFAPNPVQDTIPKGPIAAAGAIRVLEANVSYRLLNHEISFGKSDHWMGPGKGAAMLWSNNAEDIYAFQIDRVEPLRVPGLSWLTGPFRYDFFVGSLKGHTYPNDPWVHVEKISFKPTRDLEFGFSRMVIWGGKGHEPITLRTFLRSFFSAQNVPIPVKDSSSDPGARFGTFDFSYRVPGLRRWVTVYTDSLVHDDVSPVSAPQRSGIRPGIYLARFPRCEHLDLRVEAASTDPPVSSAQSGQFLYWEGVQRQGPTNKGFLVGDWVGRQDKGGQAWLTYHLSPREEVQIDYRNAKAASAFIPGGTSQNDFAAGVRKRVMKTIEIYARMQYERWKVPLYMPGAQSNARAEVRITWFPHE